MTSKPAELCLQTQVRSRMPTVSEACDFLMRFRGDAYRDYRRNYLAWFREFTNDTDADRLEAMVRERWKS